MQFFNAVLGNGGGGGGGGGGLGEIGGVGNLQKRIILETLCLTLVPRS